MATPKTKDWDAWIDLMPGPKSPTLHVKGSVETTSGNQFPELSEAIPQGINPKILILVLGIKSTGNPGTDPVEYRPATFSKPAKKGQYSQVDIRWEGDIIESIPVKEVH